MTEQMDAAAALKHANRVEGATRRDSGWYARYLVVFAAGQLVLVPMAVLWRGPAAAIVFSLTNGVLIGGLSLYASRQRVIRRGFGARHGSVIGAWGVAFGVTVALGGTAFEDSVFLAVAGALACALPPAIGAWLETRRSA